MSESRTTESSDAIVVGHGLAGLVAACELLDAGKRVTIVDQEPLVALGGQAFWSFGGLFLVDSPEQRRLGVHDSLELARQDWFGSAGFDREDEDAWGRRWAEAYLEFAAGEKHDWLRERGIRIFPVVGWAERGGSSAGGHGNSVPRFHLTWGTGPGVVAPFARRVQDAAASGILQLRHRRRVDELVVEGGAVVGVRGAVLADDPIERGQPSNRDVVGEFELRAPVVILATGGIGGNHDLVRAAWPERLGTPPERMISGVPQHVDGRMLGIAEAAGARLVNGDRMWHYVEGIRNWAPIWPQHGIRILPGPSSMWFDATGKRLPAPNFPGYDTLASLEHIRSTGYDHTWFVLTQRIIAREFALSGSEQNPDLTGRSWRKVLGRVGPGAPGPVEAFKQYGEDFVVADTLEKLFAGMLAKTDAPLDTALIERQLRERDAELANPFSKDPQLAGIRNARRFVGDRIARVASPHRILDPKAGPLIAVKLHILTRKSLGGIQTDLDARVLTPAGTPLPGLYAAGEVAGFGGGGMHGYRALEGTFLGGCLFSGRTAGRAAAAAV